MAHGQAGKRRGRDSNPRWCKHHTGFRDRPDRPLRHLSVSQLTSAIRHVIPGVRQGVRLAPRGGGKELSNDEE